MDATTTQGNAAPDDDDTVRVAARRRTRPLPPHPACTRSAAPDDEPGGDLARDDTRATTRADMRASVHADNDAGRMRDACDVHKAR